jgi:hypothetical protein
MKKRVVFFGFSVTRYGNPPYPIRLKQLLAEAGHENFDIHFAALGGVGLECVPYITDHLKKLTPDLLIFEIGTSHYSIEKKDISITKNILLQVINGASAFCQHIDFLLLPRNDIPTSCTIPSALSELSLTYKFGLMDYRDIFADEWDVYADDNVHPTKKGIDKISSLIKNRLLNDSFQLIEKQDFNKSAIEIYFKDLVPHHEYPLLRLFEYTNFSYPAIPLRMNETLELKLERDCILCGIFYIMGPDTSSLNLTVGDDTTTVRAFDKYSYYYRVGFSPFYKDISVNSNQTIKLESSENRLNTTLEKSSALKFDGIINYPISLACKLLN